MSRSKLQKGSMGDEVKELQTLLNDAGIKTDVDGLFSDWTNAAVMEYQYRNNLDANGIVDEKTWESLLGSADSDKSTTISAPNATAPKYDSTSFNDTAEGKNLWDAYDKAQQAVNNHGDYKYANQAQLDAIMQSILNRQPFSYDFNEDAFYQQYKDKYIQQGKMAMQDAMGQAAAMTGGYGNSYAQSVGQQTFQGYLQQLNDKIPELYQLALNKYNQDGQDLKDKYGMLTDDYNRGYQEHQDEYSRLMDMLGIARGDYYDRGDIFRTEQSNKNSIAGKEFDDAMAIYNANTDQAWREADWNRDQTWRDEDIAREAARQKVEDEQWQKQFDATYGKASTGGTGGGSGSPGGSDGGGSGAGWDNENVAESAIKQIQEYLGITADGKWGEQSKAAAGGLGALAAYKAWKAGTLAKNGEQPTSGFTGHSYSEAVAYMKQNGVAGAKASGVMTQTEWARRKASYRSTGTGGAEVTNYDSYAEYLRDYVEYAIENKGN